VANWFSLAKRKAGVREWCWNLFALAAIVVRHDAADAGDVRAFAAAAAASSARCWWIRTRSNGG
jgi:hypothetical protein